MYIPTMIFAKEPTFWQEAVEYFRNYFSIAYSKPYENLGFGTGTMISVPMIIIALAIGIIIAAFASVIDKRVLGDFIRALLSEECLSKESAKTLDELGYSEKYIIRNSVRRGTNIRSVVRCVEEEQYNEKMAAEREAAEREGRKFVEIPYKVDADRDHFYIPEEKKYKADMKFNKRGTSWGGFALIAVLTVVLAIVLLFVMPKILDFVDTFIGAAGASGKSKIV